MAHVNTVGSLAVISLLLLAAPHLVAQRPSLSFEVVSIKPSAVLDARGFISPAPGGRFTMSNGTVLSLIRFAYDLTSDEAIVNEPNWVTSERYDMNAKAEASSPSMAELRAMLKSTLMERMRLSAHTEQTEAAIFALTLARSDSKLGQRLTASPIDCDIRRKDIAAGKAPPLTPSPATGPASPCTIRSRADSLTSGGTMMPVLATILTQLVGRVVVDRTGLSGDYQFNLEFAPTGNGFSVSDTPSSFPSIFTALEEQLGLKLESTRGPVEVLVIDHIEKPTPD